MYYIDHAKMHSVSTFDRVILLFNTQHKMGLYGMPRRIIDYLPIDELTLMNQIASVGAFMVGAAYVLFIYNIVKSSMFGKPADTRDPFELEKGMEYYYDYARRDPHH